MTTRGPNTRRDAKTKGGNVIKGFRMEPDLARLLTDYARERFTDEADGRADLARAARYLMRVAQQITPADDNGPLPVKTRGLMIDHALQTALARERESTELGEVATIRHVLRIALGIDPSESFARERKFAMIAEIRRGETI